MTAVNFHTSHLYKLRSEQTPEVDAPTDLSIEAISLRYRKVTGFKAEAVKLSRNGTGYVACIDLVILGTITGSGKLVGQGGIIAGKMKVSDSFNIMQLKNSEDFTL